MEAAMGNEKSSSSGGGGGGKWSWICTVVAADTTNFSYRACSTCEATLPPPDSTACSRCTHSSSSSSSKRLYRLLLSVATHETVTPVVLFDRSARVVMGCSADDLFSLCRAHPSAARAAAEALRGEMFTMTISTPQHQQQHPRAVSVVPLRAGFRPIVHRLRQQQGCPKFTIKEKLVVED